MMDEHPIPSDPDRDPSDSEALNERRAAVLRHVVDAHVATAQPVGSQQIAGRAGLHVSPATIRNELSALERDGFLTHPHTSAGRVPTDKGYRYIVDHPGTPPSLARAEVERVSDFFDRAHGELERLLADTSRLLSDLTAHAAVVVAPEPAMATIRSIQVVDLAPGSALVVAVLSNGMVEKASFEPDAGAGAAHLAAATAHLSARLVGRPLDQVGATELLRTGDPLVDAVCTRAREALADDVAAPVAEPGLLHVAGASRVAQAFDAVDTVRRVLNALEEHYVVISLLRDAVGRSASVSIGAEHGSDGAFQQLVGCSIVAAPYLVDGRVVGRIGVLGPTRMNYPQAMAAVAAVGERLSNRLSDG